MWKKIKKIFGEKQNEAPVSDADHGVCWIDKDDPDNPWNVRLLDLRSITLNMLSVTENPQCAENLASLRSDDGSCFRGIVPDCDNEVEVDLTYKIEDSLAEGALFRPSEMEHKWALYYYDRSIICVRSWTREVQAVAICEEDGNHLRVRRVKGRLGMLGDSSQFVAREMDFLIRSHALGEGIPAPLDSEPSDDGLRATGIVFMSLFGNMVRVASMDDFPVGNDEIPLRTDTQLHLAAAKGDFGPVDRLAGDKGALTRWCRTGQTPLHWVTHTEGKEMFAHLLELGTPVDVKTAEGTTSLMLATQQDAKGLVELLLTAGANVRAVDNRGFTALHRAAEMGHVSIVKQLLAAGAAADADAEGHTPLSLAEMRNEKKVLKLLRTAI